MVRFRRSSSVKEQARSKRHFHFQNDGMKHTRKGDIRNWFFTPVTIDFRGGFLIDIGVFL